MSASRWTIALVAASACVPLPSSAGVIRGTVRAPASTGQPAAAVSAYPGRAGTMPGMHAAPRGLVKDAVVYVAHLSAEADSAIGLSGVRPKLSQQDQSFVPRVLAVAVGTAVDFPNLDPIYHNVFSLSPVKRFDLGKYPRGHSKTVVFNRTGIVNVYCDIHSDMEAFVFVVPHRAFAQPAADGSYVLPDLPAGRYEVRVWHPDRGEISRTVEVPATGSVAVDLSY